MSEQPDHLADNHAAPEAGALGAADAMGDATEALLAAMRRHYAVSSGNAPFLTFDAIARRVADTPDADPSAQFSALAADELAAADEWRADDSHGAIDTASVPEKEMRMTPSDPHADYDAYQQSARRVRADRYDTAPASVADGDARWARIRSAAGGAASDNVNAPPYPPAQARDSKRANRPPARRGGLARGALAVAAAIVIVGLLGGVFYAFGFSHRGKGPIVHHTPPVIHYLGAKAKWQTIGQFADDRSTTTIAYFVAQSNPMIVYRYNYANNFVLERSSDAGATWQDLSLPQQDFPGVSPQNVDLTISPVNPQILILLLGSDQNNPDCPAYVNAGIPGTENAVRHARSGQASALSASARLAPAMPASGGYSCTFQYVSGDGGATWTTLTLPDKLKLNDSVSLQTDVDASGAVTGSRLYTTTNQDTNGQPTPATRLMMSANGGLTWTFADQQLVAGGQMTFYFAASNSGSTLFDQTIATGKTLSISNGVVTPTEFWRSDDAGAHWTDLGKTPSIDTYGDLGQLTATQVDGKTLLYSAVVNTVLTDRYGVPIGGGTTTPDSVYVSADNGKTWRHAPKAGVVPGLTALGNALGTLSDGSVVFQFTKQREILNNLPGGGQSGQILDEGSIYYSWKPGATAWMQLTPKLDEEGVSPQWVAPASNGQPETIWAFAMKGNFVYLEQCALS